EHARFALSQDRGSVESVPHGGQPLFVEELRRVIRGAGITVRQFAAIAAGPAAFVAILLFFDPVPDKPGVGRTLAVAVWLALYWLTEAIPLAATALLPVVLFPLLGVMDAQTTAGAYVNDLIFLFIG